jgi:hypothetical protein
MQSHYDRTTGSGEKKRQDRVNRTRSTGKAQAPRKYGGDTKVLPVTFPDRFRVRRKELVHDPKLRRTKMDFFSKLRYFSMPL